MATTQSRSNLAQALTAAHERLAEAAALSACLAIAAEAQRGYAQAERPDLALAARGLRRALE